MKREIALGAVVVMTGLMALPGNSQAGAPETSAARSYCQAERQANQAAFKRAYGKGSAALGRCVRKNLASSREQCNLDRKNGPSRFAARYGGTDTAAVNKCVREDLKVVTSPSY